MFRHSRFSFILIFFAHVLLGFNSHGANTTAAKSPAIQSVSPTKVTGPITSSAPHPSKLIVQQKAVENYLKSKKSFELKLKILVAFKNWADKEIISNNDKLSEDDLAQVMQYSNLLRALNPTQLTIKNCQAGAEKLIDEDLNPMSETLSTPAQVILAWLKQLCSVGK